MTTKPKRRMTPAEIAASVRRYNPHIQGRRDELLRLRAKLAASPLSNPAELAATDTELALWEARVAAYEAGNTP